MENTKKCVFCGCEVDNEDAVLFDETIMCETCCDEQTSICDECGKRIWSEDAEGSDYRTLCSYCNDHCYTNCENCGALIHNDDAYYLDDDDDDDTPYCRECYQNCTKDRVIESYGYKPEPIFYGSGNLFLGVELEVDEGGESHSNAQKIIDIANSECEQVYIKHDGSINDGFEIVTHPMDLEYHMNSMPWKEIMTNAVHMGYRSHMSTTCGLHVHCSRSAFGNTHDEQEDAIARVIYFVEAHWNELLRFSRRTETQINRWASRYGLKDTPQLTYKDAKDKRLGRYVCVNLENYNTVELRIFRGTLRYETFIATLQLVDEICNTAISLSDTHFQAMTWNEFVANIGTGKEELIDYLKLKRLYVNEPIENAEEEI